MVIWALIFVELPIYKCLWSVPIIAMQVSAVGSSLTNDTLKILVLYAGGSNL